MLRLLPFCLLLTSCGLVKLPVNVVRGAANATVGVTKKATAATKNLFDRDEKEEDKADEATATTPQQPSAELPQEDAYTPAPVRNTVFIPNKPTSPGVPAAPVPETTVPKVPAAPPLPGEVDLPDLPPLEVPE